MIMTMAYITEPSCTTNDLSCLLQHGSAVLEASVTLLITIATAIFIFNIIRYFIIESDSEAGREKARKYIIWSVLGLVVILSIWGIFSILATIFGVSAGGGHLLNDYSHMHGYGDAP